MGEARKLSGWGRDVNTTRYRGWRFAVAVVRRWWPWYAFWLVFFTADIWWMTR